MLVTPFILSSYWHSILISPLLVACMTISNVVFLSMVALNFAMEEENNELRRIICQQQLLPGGDVNNNPIEPSTNQAEENAQDADLKPKE